MPVRKYRSVSDMPAVQPLTPLDSRNLGIACELTELTYALRPWKLDPGVRKFKSAADADRHRMEWEQRQVRRPTER